MDNCAVVVNPKIAKRLCSLGFKIVDIKESRFLDQKPSVFVFEDTPDFRSKLEEIKSSRS
jgi:hypothetical protein